MWPMGLLFSCLFIPVALTSLCFSTLFLSYVNKENGKSKYLKYCWELNVNMFDTEKVGSLTCMKKNQVN